MESANQSAPVSNKLLWAGRIISALPVLLLLFSAYMKFAKPPGVMEGMNKLGWPERYLLTLGILEVTCTVIYLIPFTSVLGAIPLTGYLGGATATHARIGDPMFIMPAITGVLVWVGLLFRERRLKPLLPLRS
jgi:hypothetical protein